MLTIWPIVYYSIPLNIVWTMVAIPPKALPNPRLFALRLAHNRLLLILWLQQYGIVIKINYSHPWKTRSYRRTVLEDQLFSYSTPYTPSIEISFIDLNGSRVKYMLFNVQCIYNAAEFKIIRLFWWSIACPPKHNHSFASILWWTTIIIHFVNRHWSAYYFNNRIQSNWHRRWWAHDSFREKAISFSFMERISFEIDMNKCKQSNHRWKSPSCNHYLHLYRYKWHWVK